MPITKSDLIEQLSEKLRLPKGKAETVVNVMFDTMIEALQREERIEIRGFGSFEVRHYKAYEGRNPRTGDPVHVAPKRLPFFKVGKELRERVNGEEESPSNGSPSSSSSSSSGSAVPTATGGFDEGSGPVSY
jgi:integration host factor subunit beta